MTPILLHGDCRTYLAKMKPDSIHCVVTSPPYWGLRDYGVPPTIWGGDPECAHDWTDLRWYTEQSAAKSAGSSEAFSKPGPENAQRLKDARWRTASTCNICGAWKGAYGLEDTYQRYVDNTVAIFREVRRVLRPDGTLWLNLGDSYATGAGKVGAHPGGGKQGENWRGGHEGKHGYAKPQGPMTQPNRLPQPGLKPKDLVGIPWRVAFALQADGWWLRQDIIWHKPAPMPESVRDRCTKAHEYIFLLTKSETYYYDYEAVKEPSVAKKGNAKTFRGGGAYTQGQTFDNSAKVERQSHGNAPNETGKRNRRSVWTIATEPFPEAHFATFPPALVEPCILAGCPPDGYVLDPFGGSGTTGLVAQRLNRQAILLEQNADYIEIAKKRLGII